MAKCNCDSCPVAAGTKPGRRRGLRRLPLAAWIFLIVAIGTLILDAVEADAEVYHSRESALQMAFPGADSVTTRTLTLDAEEADRVRSRAGATLESRIVRVYEAWQDGKVTSRGIIDTHKVRSLPETLLVVAGRDHRVEAVHLLAFHEPEQYRASERWYAQFADRRLEPALAVRRDIAGIAGATMTSNAVTAAVRRCLATLEVGFGPAATAAAIGK